MKDKDEKPALNTSPQFACSAKMRCTSRNDCGQQCIHDRGHVGPHGAFDGAFIRAWPNVKE
jgi:hypothetical protein